MLRLPILVLSLLLAFSPIGLAADGQKSAEDAGKAVQDLTRHTEAAVKANRRPAFDKPPASGYLARVLNAQALASLPAAQGKDLPWLVQWADAMNKVNHLLIFTGAKSTSEADQRAAVEQNMNEYEDVLFPAWAFMARMQVRLLITADLFMKELPAEQRTPVRLRGHAQIRDGHIQFVQGALTTIAAGVKPANAKTLTAALRETAPTWAPRINAQEQDRLRTTLIEAQRAYQEPALRDDLAGLALMIEGVKPK